MSKLNIGASEFVPGRAFRLPQSTQDSSASAQPVLKPIERPEQTEAPLPPPTITLNIGGSRPPPQTDPEPAPLQAPSLEQQTPAVPPTTKVTTSIVATGSTAPSKTFTTERAKNDSVAIANDVQSLADQETLRDLFGDCQ